MKGELEKAGAADPALPENEKAARIWKDVKGKITFVEDGKPTGMFQSRDPPLAGSRQVLAGVRWVAYTKEGERIALDPSHGKHVGGEPPQRYRIQEWSVSGGLDLSAAFLLGAAFYADDNYGEGSY